MSKKQKIKKLLEGLHGVTVAEAFNQDHYDYLCSHFLHFAGTKEQEKILNDIKKKREEIEQKILEACDA